jgi:hypothetical protein
LNTTVATVHVHLNTYESRFDFATSSEKQCCDDEENTLHFLSLPLRMKCHTINAVSGIVSHRSGTNTIKSPPSFTNDFVSGNSRTKKYNVARIP